MPTVVPSTCLGIVGETKEVEDAVPAFEEGGYLSFSESRSLLFSEVEKKGVNQGVNLTVTGAGRGQGLGDHCFSTGLGVSCILRAGDGGEGLHRQ